MASPSNLYPLWILRAPVIPDTMEPLRPNKKKVTPVGFEPTRIAPPELESGALDHSAKVS